MFLDDLVSDFDVESDLRRELKKVKVDLIYQMVEQIDMSEFEESDEEAEEKMDTFISDALIQGWDEVVIYHGIGTGKLSYAVKRFLKAHPSVKGFENAPPQLGGFGAKVVFL